MTAADLPVVPPVPVPAAPAGGWRVVVRERISLRVIAASLALGFMLGTLLTAAAWTAFGAEQVGPPRDVQLVIPVGTAAEIARGGPTVIPSEIRLTEGDRLIIANQDLVDHTIGGGHVAAGMTLTILAALPAPPSFPFPAIVANSRIGSTTPCGYAGAEPIIRMVLVVTAFRAASTSAR